MTRREVIAAMRLRREVANRLERQFYAAKAREYRETLGHLAAHYGEPRKSVQLSPAIRTALRAEARRNARSVVRTYNKLMDAEARRRPNLDPQRLARHLRGFMAERARVRSQVIGPNEVATARMDAFVSFMVDNGVEPLFDFRGPAAKCPTCKALRLTGPHPVERVLAIGRPHIGCTHHFAPRFPARSKLPDRIRVGRGAPAGIVGGEPIVSREGGQTEAVQAIIDSIADTGGREALGMIEVTAR